MARFFQLCFFDFCACALLLALSAAQVPPKAATGEASSSAEQDISRASKARCREALPLLKKAAVHPTDKQIQYRVEMSTVRCAMSLDRTETAVGALLLLNREFPHDPDVLYSTTTPTRNLLRGRRKNWPPRRRPRIRRSSLRQKLSSRRKTGIKPSPNIGKSSSRNPNCMAFTIDSGGFFFRDRQRKRKMPRQNSMKN